MRFSALGDVAMTVPVVWALAREYPDVRITVLSRPYARTFFEDLAPNVNFMAADVHQEYHGVRGLNALYRRPPLGLALGISAHALQPGALPRGAHRQAAP